MVRFSLAPGLVCRDAGGETVIVRVSTGEYFGLNPTAAFILKALLAGETEEPYAGEFRIGLERAGADFRDVQGELLELGLLVPVKGGV